MYVSPSCFTWPSVRRSAAPARPCRRGRLARRYAPVRSHTPRPCPSSLRVARSAALGSDGEPVGARGRRGRAPRARGGRPVWRRRGVAPRPGQPERRGLGGARALGLFHGSAACARGAPVTAVRARAFALGPRVARPCRAFAARLTPRAPPGPCSVVSVSQLDPAHQPAYAALSGAGACAASPPPFPKADAPTRPTVVPLGAVVRLRGRLLRLGRSRRSADLFSLLQTSCMVRPDSLRCYCTAASMGRQLPCHGMHASAMRRHTWRIWASDVHRLCPSRRQLRWGSAAHAPHVFEAAACRLHADVIGMCTPGCIAARRHCSF